MSFIEVIPGQHQSWGLVKKLGEGDAGEVYLVESLLERSKAILKRPCRSSLASDTIRQASQISSEGNILKALGGFTYSKEGVTVRTPALLDRSLQKAPYGSEVFIIIEKAPGFDLKTLARYARFGMPDVSGSPDENVHSDEERLLNSVAELRSVPETILLRVLSGLLEFLNKIHATNFPVGDEKAAGILWNDVKPEHLYWDPAKETLTVIDWGNARLLAPDGGTQDRMSSRGDDVHQYLVEMGKLLEEANPHLASSLRWPSGNDVRYESFEGILPLQERLVGMLTSALEKLHQARQAEADLSYLASPDLSVLETLSRIQKQILSYGAYPDPSVIEVIYSRLAVQLVQQKKLEEFREICAGAEKLDREHPLGNPFRWKLLSNIAAIASAAPTAKQELYFPALSAGLEDDWPAVLWHMLVTLEDGPVPAWWEDLSQQIRQAYLGADGNVLAPYLAASRAFYTLQARVVYDTGPVRYPTARDPVQTENDARSQAFETLLRTFESEVIQKWKELEPDPPNSGIEYTDVQGMLGELEAAVPGIRQGLETSLEQPSAQVQIILDAWHRMDFETARRGLRILLLWDPHRRRLLTADRAIGTASKWLLRVRTGPRNGDSLQDYLPQVELAGRELRSQVAPAPWLDSILDALKKLRSGVKPADLIVEHPELLATIPWLNKVRAQETLSLPRTRPLTIERSRGVRPLQNALSGAREGRLGPDGEIFLAEPLDIWVPEALGSSARVFNGTAVVPPGEPLSLAFKIMRPDRRDYALPLFKEEASILTILHDVPGVSRIAECGFIRLEKGQTLPVENRSATAGELRGVVRRYGVNEVQNFLATLDRHTDQGWIPYMAIEKRNLKDNLMVYCDSAQTRGRFLPLRENLLLSIQICDIIQYAHDRNVAYRDHKILHYFWDPAEQGVQVIDWNIARRYPQGMPAVERQFDVVQFGARALHHILTGRPAPGSLPLGPNMLQDVELAAHTYTVHWTYDDERLPNRVKEILEKVLSEGYGTIRELRQDLLAVYEQLPETSPSHA